MGSFWQENIAFIQVWRRKSDIFLTNFQDVFDDRAKKLIEIMDKTDKAIAEVGKVLKSNFQFRLMFCCFILWHVT